MYYKRCFIHMRLKRLKSNTLLMLFLMLMLFFRKYVTKWMISLYHVHIDSKIQIWKVHLRKVSTLNADQYPLTKWRNGGSTRFDSAWVNCSTECFLLTVGSVVRRISQSLRPTVCSRPTSNTYFRSGKKLLFFLTTLVHVIYCADFSMGWTCRSPTRPAT